MNLYNVDKAGNIPAITIGVINTNKQNAVRFDIRAWQKRYPDDMIYGIWITRPGETKAQSYPAVTEVVEGILYWYVSFADTEKHGRGYASVRAVEPDAENGIYAKSFDMPIIVADSGVGDGADVPIIEVPWAVGVMQAKEAAIAAAAQAEEAVEHYPYIGENGNWWVWDAEAEEFVDTEHPARGEQGEQGVQGNPGSDGQDGVSPAITVTEITGGHSVKITDAAHPDGQTFQVMNGEQGIQGNPGSDGQDGQDGVSPSVTVTEITGGHQVTITDATHPSGQTFQVMDGEDGEPGAKGDPGDDAPQIDDTQASADHPWSGSKINTLLSDKVDTSTYTAGMALKENKHTEQTVTIAAASWSGQSVTVSVTGVTASNLVQLTPLDKASADAWVVNGVFCTVQGNGTLTFSCVSTPTTSIGLGVIVW